MTSLNALADDRRKDLPGGYYLFQIEPDHMTCSLHAPDGLHIGNIRSAEASCFADSLRAASSPAPDVTVDEIARELWIDLFGDLYRGGWESAYQAAVSGQDKMAYQRVESVLSQARAVYLLFQPRHRPATTRDDGWQDISTAPRDGREVLLYLGAPWNKVEKARWYAPWSNWQCGEFPSDSAQEDYSGIGSSVPTHWRPIPSAPDPARAGLHPATADLVSRFANALSDKLAKAEKKYGHSDGWALPNWQDECRQHLRQHVEKGDPLDVAAYAVFMWHHGWSSAPDPSGQVEEAIISATAGRLDETATTQSELHPLAAFPGGLHPGLYRIYWKSGGVSEAAIGMQSDGTRWIAPTNWIRPNSIPSAGRWADIDRAERITLDPLGQPDPASSFQSRVAPWVQACFGLEISADKIERNYRFLEEALELVQACGCTKGEAQQLVDYVFDRDVGEKHQEVGGVMVTLASLCLAQGLDMHQAAEDELARIWTKIEEIRAKQASKPKHSPLPQHVDRASAGIDADVGVPRGDPHRFAVVSSDYSRPFLLGAYETLAAAQLAQCGNPGRWPIYERLAAPTPPSPKGGNETDAAGVCATCQGNGEVVTDWDRYLHVYPGDIGDEAVAECEDCNGSGRCDSASGAQGFTIRARVRKVRGSSWQGRVVGYYSTTLTPRGVCVESEREPGSVQIYPESALEIVPEEGSDGR